MLGMPVATELLMAISALIGATTTTVLALWAFWRRVLRPIRDGVSTELNAWSDMREAVSARFETDLGSVGLTAAMRHVIASLESIDNRLAEGDRKFACIERKLDAIRNEVAGTTRSEGQSP